MSCTVTSLHFWVARPDLHPSGKTDEWEQQMSEAIHSRIAQPDITWKPHLHERKCLSDQGPEEQK